MEERVGKSLSVIKNIRQSVRKQLINQVYIKRIKFLKKSIKKLIEGAASKDELMKKYAEYCSAVDKAQKKNIIHKNNAARKKSRTNAMIKSCLLKKA